MKTNEGTADRTIRILIAAFLIVLYMSDIITGTLGYVLLAVAGIFAITGVAGVCPLYTLFGISSCKNKNTQKINR